MEVPETKGDSQEQHRHPAADHQKMFTVVDMVEINILSTDKETNIINGCVVHGVVLGILSVVRTEEPHYYVMGEEELSNDNCQGFGCREHGSVANG